MHTHNNDSNTSDHKNNDQEYRRGTERRPHDVSERCVVIVDGSEVLPEVHLRYCSEWAIGDRLHLNNFSSKYTLH